MDCRLRAWVHAHAQSEVSLIIVCSVCRPHFACAVGVPCLPRFFRRRRFVEMERTSEATSLPCISLGKMHVFSSRIAVTRSRCHETRDRRTRHPKSVTPKELVMRRLADTPFHRSERGGASLPRARHPIRRCALGPVALYSALSPRKNAPTRRCPSTFDKMRVCTTYFCQCSDPTGAPCVRRPHRLFSS